MVAEHGVKLVLDAEDLYVLGNSTREGFLHGSGSVAFRRSYCFKRGDMQFYLSSKTALLTVDFNATTQRVGVASFNNTNKGTYLTGAYPAMLETTGNVRKDADASLIQTPLCNVPVTGGLGFHQCGEGNTFTLAKQDFASCGDLEVSGGKLPAVALDPVQAWVMPRVTASGELRTLTVVNTTIDTNDPVRFRLRGVPATCTQAVWRALDAQPVTVPGQRDGADAVVTVPSLAAWSAGWLKIVKEDCP